MMDCPVRLRTRAHQDRHAPLTPRLLWQHPAIPTDPSLAASLSYLAAECLGFN
jgi:hypothetical protein